MSEYCLQVLKLTSEPYAPNQKQFFEL